MTRRRSGLSPTLALMAGMALLPLVVLLDTAPGGGGTDPAPADPPADPAPADPPADPPANPPAPAEPQDVKSLPQWAQNVIAEARKEAATNRVGRTAAETARTEALKAMAATLGVDVTTGAPTVEAVQGQLTTVTGERDAALAQARAAQVQVAAIPVAAKHGADLAALMDSASFLAKLGQLDPAASDFAGQLDTAVKAAVDGNPRLKAGQAPARGGFDPAGGTGGDKPAASMEEAYARRFAPKS